MNASATIFVSAYRDFAVRYLLYTDVLKELQRSGVRVVVFLKDDDLEFYRRRFHWDNVILEPIFYEEALTLRKTSRLNHFFVLVRKCMSGSRRGLRNTTDFVRVYQYSKEASHSIAGFVEFQLVKLVSRIGRRIRAARVALVALESRCFPGKMYDVYFEKYKPDMLIVTSLGHMIDAYFMRAAKRHGCKVVSVMRNFDSPTTKGYRGAKIDYVVAWNDIMKKEINIFHDIPEKRITVTGIAHWDFYFGGQFKPRTKEEVLASNSLSEDRKVIFYATSGFKMFRRTFDAIEQLLEAIEADCFVFPVQLLVRLHPAYLVTERSLLKDHEGQVIDRYKERMTSIKSRYGDLVSFMSPMMKVLNVGIDMPVEDMYQLAESLFYSDVLLTEYSTVMIEAAIFDLPVINVGLFNFRDTEEPASYVENYTHIKRILKTGASRDAYTTEQLFEYINYYLEDRSRDREKRKKLVDQEVTTNRGYAGKAIGRMVLEIIGKEL